MKKNKSTKSSISSLTEKFMKINRAILFIVVFCASISIALATPVDVTAPPYNAAGDDIVDDRIPIQNAIYDLSAAGGGTVYFPPGLYRISGTIYVPSNIRLQGMGSTVHNTQIRLTPTQTAMFEIENGASNVVFMDLALVANSRPHVYPRNTAEETALIRTEGTTGISFKPGVHNINNIVIENVRITQFTYGISVPFQLGYNNSITDVKIRNYVSDGNEYSLYTNMPGATGWDVQNMNVYPMYHGQNGIFLERSGEMRFLQLSCAGTNSGICAKLWGNGNTYFRQMHVEGPRLGFCVGSNCDQSSQGNMGENSSVLTIENSATDGEFHRATNIVSINNRFWLDFPQPPAPPPPAYKFFGTGGNSSLKSCGNVWVSWNPNTHMSNTTVDPPSWAFPGLNTSIQGCLNSYLTSVPVFNTGYEADDERLNGEVNVTDYGAIPDDGLDDTNSFMRAISDARLTRGRRVFVPRGTFDISQTLTLVLDNAVPGEYDGQTILGVEGSVINLTATGIALFKIVNINGSPINGITFRNLTLTSDFNINTIGINFENFSSSVVGVASDFQIQNVDFFGFGIGFAVQPKDGIFQNPEPMFDSGSIKDAEFIGNKTAILFTSSNASNWNLEDIKVIISDGDEGIRINRGGHISTRNLTCYGYGAGTACMTIQRQSGTSVENLFADGVLNALVVPWENGWTQFPITLRNNNFEAGVYFQGRIYLNSVNNTYPARFLKNSTSREVIFGNYYEGNVNNVAPGRLSNVFSCNDIFTDPPLTQDIWAYSGFLDPMVIYCN